MATRLAGGGCKANDAHPIAANKRKIVIVPAARSGSEDDMSRDAWQIRVVVDVT
jgi:hypothetical protein